MADILSFFGFFKKFKPHVEIEMKSEPSGLESVLLALEDGILMYDQEFTVLFFNPAAERIFNLRAAQVIGKKILPQDIQREDKKLLAQVVYPSLAPTVVTRSEPGQYPQVADLSFNDPPVELRVLTSPTAGKDGGVTGFMKIVHDRSRELAVLRSKNEFVAIASHQLRSPLTNIRWALDVLAKDDTLKEESRNIAQSALEASERLLAVVEDLLNISKIEEGRFGYDFAPVDIVELINGILEEAAPRAKGLGMKLYFDKPAEQIPQVSIDIRKITMAVQNILDNALRYNVQNGEVHVMIELLSGEPYVRVSIKDTGIGISPNDEKKIFMKFFRSENAVRAETEGSGIGLYVARNIVRSHGGKMWFESEQGRGSTFFFTLPTDPNLIPQKEIPLD